MTKAHKNITIVTEPFQLKLTFKKNTFCVNTKFYFILLKY